MCETFSRRTRYLRTFLTSTSRVLFHCFHLPFSHPANIYEQSPFSLPIEMAKSYPTDEFHISHNDQLNPQSETF